MQRNASRILDAWLADAARLPLVIRGARQVGKTWLARDLAARHGLDLLECNFERAPSLARAFVSNEPREILGQIGLALGRDVPPANALLFLDEVQAAREVLPKLRWFAEGLPELPVLAAGSLLDFTLGDHGSSMPVGRVSYLHLHPLDFPEFLRAHTQDALHEVLAGWTWEDELSEIEESRAGEWFTRFTMVGGMPAVVQIDVDGGEPQDIRRRQHDLLATFADDFGKYATRIEPALLDAILRSVATHLGRKFVYSHVREGVRHERARRGLELLDRSRVCHIVEQTAANGLPLGGEVNRRNRKVILLDVGLAHALLGTPATSAFPVWDDLAPTVQGAITEQVLGQELLSIAPPWQDPHLYYWQRGGGRVGKVDYVVQVGTDIVPVEAKGGASGALKSLHQFMHDKSLSRAVHIARQVPSRQDVEVKTTQGDAAAYRLFTVPHFLAWRLEDVVGS